jgi:16S rRNA processing protein RimM
MRVRVARIGKPFGVAGLVTIHVLTDEPQTRFQPDAVLWCDGRELRIDIVRRSGGRWVLGFAGIGDRDEAESLRGGDLYADVVADARPEHPDEWYDRDLIGLPCRGPAGQELGVVVAVEHPPAHDLLVLRTLAGHDARIPFVAAIVPAVSPSGIVIDAPPGLLEPDLEVPGT